MREKDGNNIFPFSLCLMKLGEGIWHTQLFLGVPCFLDLPRLSRMSMFWFAYIHSFDKHKGLSLRFGDVNLDYDSKVSIIDDLNPSVLWKLFKIR